MVGKSGFLPVATALVGVGVFALATQVRAGGDKVVFPEGFDKGVLYTTVDRADNIEGEGSHANPERSLWNRQLGHRIHSALQDLTPRERMVFELRHYQGLRLRVIGEMLGTSEEAAKNCLFRATQKMRVILGDLV